MEENEWEKGSGCVVVLGDWLLKDLGCRLGKWRLMNLAFCGGAGSLFWVRTGCEREIW